MRNIFFIEPRAQISKEVQLYRTESGRQILKCNVLRHTYPVVEKLAHHQVVCVLLYGKHSLMLIHQLKLCSLSVL
jgi:hypothetical protein